MKAVKLVQNNTIEEDDEEYDVTPEPDKPQPEQPKQNKEQLKMKQ